VGASRPLVDPALGKGADIRFLNADVFRQQLLQGQKGGQVHAPQIQTVSCPSHVVGVKVEKQGAPQLGGEPPPNVLAPLALPGKSSSLSREISPSRITAQVVSAMSESSQPLLLSVLTGKMPAPMIITTSSQSLRPPEQFAAAPVLQQQRRSPYHVPENRRSPMNQEVGGHGRGSQKTFEHLTQVAALFRAQESQSAQQQMETQTGKLLIIIKSKSTTGSSGRVVDGFSPSSPVFLHP
jgi:hypothetical protein